jgi:amidase
MDDYTPIVDLERYPRTDVHVPEDTVGGGWALKVNKPPEQGVRD